MPRLRSIGCLAAAFSLCATAYGQVPTEAVGKGEFPALQFLPPGSVLKGISLPRYEKHRVSSLLTAERLEVKSNTLVVLSKVRAYLYDKDGDTMEVEADEVQGDFSLSRVSALGKITVTSPKFQAQGQGFTFSQERNTGLVKGPVSTVIRTGTDKGTPTVNKNK